MTSLTEALVINWKKRSAQDLGVEVQTAGVGHQHHAVEVNQGHIPVGAGVEVTVGVLKIEKNTAHLARNIKKEATVIRMTITKGNRDKGENMPVLLEVVVDHIVGLLTIDDLLIINILIKINTIKLNTDQDQGPTVDHL